MNDRTDKWLTTLLWAVVLIGLVIYIMSTYNRALDKIAEPLIKQYDSDVVYSFNCASSHNDRLWSCKDGGFQNLTGQYCNSTMICQNTWRYK